MRPALCALVALGLVASAPQAHAGVVFVDRDGDGTQDPDERGRAGVRVVAGDVVATTDAAGRFALAAAPGAIVWARTPADARSVPTWAVMPATGEPQLALTTAPSGGPLTFAVAADSHHDLIPDDGWDDAALDRALAQVAAAAPGARFVALLGDLSQSAFADELDQVATHARAAGLPLVPVPGNHDWYDLGVAYAARFGPDQYSLDVPGARVLVWNGNLEDAAIEAFVARELADAPTVPVIALGHQSPSDALAAAMARLGVDALFTGHWHAARALQRGPTLREWGLPPLTMGGVDGSAAGFAIAALGEAGFTLRREATTVEPTLALVGGCVRDQILIDARAVGGAAGAVAEVLRVGAGHRPHALEQRVGAVGDGATRNRSAGDEDRVGVGDREDRVDATEVATDDLQVHADLALARQVERRAGDGDRGRAVASGRAVGTGDIRAAASAEVMPEYGPELINVPSSS